jgi:phosphatidylglycerophosphate synthase
MTLAELRTLPNLLTAARGLLLPVLWIEAFRGDALVVGIGLAVCFWLDFGDGFVARRLGQTSAFGSKFDSIVDGFIGPSAIVWLLLLEPRTLLDHKLLAATWFAITYLSLAVGLVKFRRFANLHLQSSRIACVFQYAFLVDAFAAPPVLSALLYAAGGLGILSSLEALVMQLFRDCVHERMRSILATR